jgi:hypothetical protein
MYQAACKVAVRHFILAATSAPTPAVSVNHDACVVNGSAG